MTHPSLKPWLFNILFLFSFASKFLFQVFLTFGLLYPFLAKPLQHKLVPLSLLVWWGLFSFLIHGVVIPTFTFSLTNFPSSHTFVSSFFLCFVIFQYFKKGKSNLIFKGEFFILEFLFHATTCMFSSCLSDLDWITRIFAICTFCLVLEGYSEWSGGVSLSNTWYESLDSWAIIFIGQSKT